jgi:hypothetical protein
MAQQHRKSRQQRRQMPGGPGPVTAADVVRLCGQIDDAKLAAIVAAQPTAAELEEAVAWLAGEGEPLAKAARPLVGKTAVVYAILESDLGEPDERAQA